VAVGERLKDALELLGLVVGQPGTRQRGAALNEGKDDTHATHYIEMT
jgi:hypothetical protein